MDIHSSIMDISITELWISLITDIHNSVMDIYNYTPAPPKVERG